MTELLTHTDDCGYSTHDERNDCEPHTASWDQPGGWYVHGARLELEDDAPWWRIWQRAWELHDEDGAR